MVQELVLKQARCVLLIKITSLCLDNSLAEARQSFKKLVENISIQVSLLVGLCHLAVAHCFDVKSIDDVCWKIIRTSFHPTIRLAFKIQEACSDVLLPIHISLLCWQDEAKVFWSILDHAIHSFSVIDERDRHWH